MNRWKWIAAALVMPLVAVTVMAAGPQHGRFRADTQIIDNTTYFDANSLLMFVTNTGSIAYDKTAFFGKNDGLYFPRGTNKSVIYAGGVWMGAKVDGEIRGFVSEYSNECVPGPMADGTFQSDRGRFHVYKIALGDTRESNPDYRDWPFEDGAPYVKDANGDPVRDADNNMIPLLQGDQALWCVYNDADPSAHANDAMGTSPMGVEVHQYVFGYSRAGALGQTIFVRYQIINKGGNNLEDTYISLWADPDLGDAGDDFVGCDTVLSLGYCYNDGPDNTYGDRPPAVGYDFFQGPVVATGNNNDSAWVSSKGMYLYGYKNLPMTSFNKYINGTDPHSRGQTYNYMQGLTAEGDPQSDPFGHVTTFVVAGDPVNPVAGVDWLDDASDDRRYMMSTGPFNMAPGDTQEVVAAVVVGQGTDRLNSVTELKKVDKIAQQVFDLNFNIPGPPPQPSIWAVPRDGAVQLFWGLEGDGNVQYLFGPPTDESRTEDTLQTFVMEGLNIYQGLSSSGPWTKIATYDVVDGIERIYFDLDQPNGIERVVTQYGTETGLVHDLLVSNDRIRGGNLINNRPYYFTVTAYNYDEQNARPYLISEGGEESYGTIAESFENLQGAAYVEAVPRSMTGVLSETADHTAGISDGSVLIDFIDQNMITGDDYTVDFNEDGTWNLNNETTGMTDLSDQAAQLSEMPVDGFVVRVLGPEAGIKAIVETANGSGPVDPPDNVKYSLNSTGDWYVSSDQGSNFDRLNWRGLIGISDWEFRFTAEGSEYYDYNTDELWPDRAPFEIWNIGPGTINDASDDQRVFFEIIDDDESGGWSMGDRIYVVERPYVEPLPDVAEYDFPADFHLGRVVINDNSGNGAPPTGTVIRFTTNKPNQAGDVFSFSTHAPGSVEGTVVKETVEDVAPVPNPYYNLTPLEKDQFRRELKFINLPAAKTTIRIFNLAGDLVRTLTKDDAGSAEITWDVLTEAGLPVASGLYIYYVEAEGLGSKVGKVAVFTEVEQLQQY